MPSFLVPRSYGQETPDPLGESKELLSKASDALHAVVDQFGTDRPRLVAAFPAEGFQGNGFTLTAHEKPEGYPPGMNFQIAREGGSTCVCSVVKQKQGSVVKQQSCVIEQKSTRCGDAAGNEQVYIFRSGITIEKYAGFAIDSIDEIGDAQAVPADKLYEYRRQERIRQASVRTIGQRIYAIGTSVRQGLAAISRCITGKCPLHPQGVDMPAAAPTAPRINPSLITRGTLELMLRKHADALQAAAAILQQNVASLQTRIAELKQQEAAAAAAETEAAQPALPQPPATGTQQEQISPEKKEG